MMLNLPKTAILLTTVLALPTLSPKHRVWLVASTLRPRTPCWLNHLPHSLLVLPLVREGALPLPAPLALIALTRSMDSHLLLIECSHLGHPQLC